MKAYLLRTCGPDLKSYGGFQWPESGPVEAPDWSPDPRCGNGLHGWLWGEGDGIHGNWSPDARWLVVEVDAASVVDLTGKVKVPKGVVVHAGDRKSATDDILARGATGAVIGVTRTAAVIGATLTGGYGAVLTGGYGAVLTGGNHARLTGGDFARLSGGDDAVLSGGSYATLTGGHGAALSGGSYAWLTGANHSVLTGGEGSRLAGGDCAVITGACGAVLSGGSYSRLTGGEGASLIGERFSTFTGGDGATFCCRWYDGAQRLRLVTAVVGEGGIEPDQPYRVDDHGHFRKA